MTLRLLATALAVALLDRYAAQNANFVLIASDRIAVLAARSAARDTDNQPRALPGDQGQSLRLVGDPSAQEPQQDQGEARRLRDASAVFGEIMSAEDQAIPRAILGKAEGIAIFPSTVKAGFVVGGMRGRGVLSARTPDGWSSPAFLTLTGGSFGLQIGGQAADIVLVINDRRGLENLVRNQFKLGADAGVAAGPVGRDAQAATDIQLRAQILSYSRARGLFAGVTINGSTIRSDRDANERFYGKPLETKEIVFDGASGAPPPVDAWLDTLRRLAS